MENNKNKGFEQGENKEILWIILFGIVAFIALAIISRFWQ